MATETPISPQWTVEERLKLIKARINQLEAIVHADTRKYFVDRAVVEAYLEQMRMLGTMPAAFLEEHRMNVLDDPMGIVGKQKHWADSCGTGP